ncbi:hypothetical protein FRC01_000139, partial [Tulasnella sp. 417]
YVFSAQPANPHLQDIKSAFALQDYIAQLDQINRHSLDAVTPAPEVDFDLVTMTPSVEDSPVPSRLRRAQRRMFPLSI